MRKNLLAVLALSGVVLFGHQSGFAQDSSTQAGASQSAQMDQDILLLRKDIRSQKKQIIAANLPLTDTEAQTRLEASANHLVEQYFGPMPEGGAAERRLTIRVPGNLADRVEAAAKGKGLSLNSYAMRCFERCAAADGQPAGQDSR